MTKFTERMIDACTYADAGFYYEEEGQVGMTVALLDAFESDGFSPRIAVMRINGYPLVELNGSYYDHQGPVLNNVGDVDFIGRETLMLLGATQGRSEFELASDIAAAKEIVASARELNESYEQIEGAIMENLHFDSNKTENFIQVLRNKDIIAVINPILQSSKQSALLMDGQSSQLSHFAQKTLTTDVVDLIRDASYDAHSRLCLKDMVQRVQYQGFWNAVRAPDAQMTMG